MSGVGLTERDLRVIGEAVQRSDYLRRSPASVGGRAEHKEWFHFLVASEQLDILINFSICDELRHGFPREAEIARLTLMVREAGRGWDGDIDTFDKQQTILTGGRLQLAMDHNELDFRDGEFVVKATLRDRPIRVALRLRPQTMPSLANNVQLDAGPPLNWLLVSRLSARGSVWVDGRHHDLTNVPAYHDHNWGNFAWGRDFAWEWGFGLPMSDTSRNSLVFVRLSDRGHTTALQQTLMVWDGMRQKRVFRAEELNVRSSGSMRPTALFKLPRPMALLAPDLLPDVPRTFEIEAEADGDCLHCCFESEDIAQVIVPNDRDFGLTIINEVSGSLRAHGSVRGTSFSLEGRGVFEFLRH